MGSKKKKGSALDSLINLVWDSEKDKTPQAQTQTQIPRVPPETHYDISNEPDSPSVDEKTININEMNQAPKVEDKIPAAEAGAFHENTKITPQGERRMQSRSPQEVKTVQGSQQTNVPYSNRSQAYSSGSDSQEALLKQSEFIRIAEAKIVHLEKQVETLRLENERLASAGETFRDLKDELSHSHSQLSQENEDLKEVHASEVEIYKEKLSQKEESIERLNGAVADLEKRLDTGVKKVRKREQELEHRLELSKYEESALIEAKDKLILELKKKVADFQSNISVLDSKNQSLYKQLKSRNDAVRRVIKALRISLVQLETEDDVDS